MIKIAHLYYDLMNLYGDNGNLKALKYQLDHQGIKSKIEFLTIGDNIDFSKYDFIYMGPGTDYNQKLVLKDIMKYKNNIKEAIDNNTFFLITGNALDLFGKYILDENGRKTNTLNLFDFYSKNESFRLVDEVIAKTPLLSNYVLGFQNQGSTMHNLDNPLFEMIKGIGAYPNSNIEGINYKNFYGTYFIGPILVRNPELLKLITKKLLLHKDNNFKFKRFNLLLEQQAHDEYIRNRYDFTTDKKA